MKKKVLISTSVVLLLAVVGFYFLFTGSTKKYEFRLDKVSQGDINVLVTATGTINAVTTVEVGTQVSGIIAKLYADFNSIVKAGQVIAQIDPTFLQQSVKDAEANLDRVQAQFADSKRIYERTQALFDKALESKASLDATQTTFESNRAALKQAQANLDRAKINLAYATIYAPIDGVVIDRKVNVGQTVAASFSSPTLYTIANDLRKMLVQTTVDESDIGVISIGQEATFTVDAYPEERFSGRVSQIRLAPVSVQNVVNYTVVIDVNNDQLKLMPGMTASVKLGVANAHDVMRVPNMALRFQPPADLIDSTKILAQRDAMSPRGGTGNDSTRGGRPGMGERGTGRFSGASGDRGWGNPEGGERAMEERRQRFGAIRDSIQAAHGGNLSQEEMRKEMGKIFGGMRGQGGRPAPVAQQAPAPATGENRFGIIQRFPQFQKSVYTPARQAGRARVWILNSQKKLEPVFVRTGLTDGRFTEIVAPDLKPGDQIVMGATSNTESAGEQGRSPLTGQGQGQRPMGGGGPR